MKRDRNPGEKKKGQPLDQVVNILMARKSDDFLPEKRSLSWWFLFLPGKALLWLQFMFPSSLGSAIASGRRKDVPIVQALASILVYLFLLSVIALISVMAFGGK